MKIETKDSNNVKNLRTKNEGFVYLPVDHDVNRFSQIDWSYVPTTVVKGIRDSLTLKNDKNKEFVIN